VFDIASLLIEAVQKKAREAQQQQLAAQIQAGLIPPPSPQPQPRPAPAPARVRPQPAPVLARPPADSMPAAAPQPVSPLLAALRGGNALIGGLIVGEVLAPPLSLRPRTLPGDTL
jgi:hypothetical protein